jgi:hypothetical protein
MLAFRMKSFKALDASLSTFFSWVLRLHSTAKVAMELGVGSDGFGIRPGLRRSS